MKILLPSLYLMAALLILSGCATGRYTLPVEDPDYQVKADKALVIFMRPSNFGGAITSSLFEIGTPEFKTTDKELIAIIGPNEKVAFYTDPGRGKRFMVVSESADFMDANLDPGKVYYAIVTPRMGLWRARFSLHPFKRVADESEFQLDSNNLVDWLDECKFVSPDDGSFAWARNNSESITKKKREYLEKWAEMPEEDKQWRRLEPEDGLDAPI